MGISPNTHGSQNNNIPPVTPAQEHTYTPPQRNNASWTTPRYQTPDEITILLVGPRSKQARKWLEECSLFKANIAFASDLRGVKAYLNSATMDICMLDMEDDQKLAIDVLTHITHYKMACAAILIDDCAASNNDADLFMAGAADICHKEDFDQTTLLHVVRNAHLRSLTAFQYRQEISRITDHLSNISHELKNPLNALLGFTHLLKKRLSNEDMQLLQFVKNIETNNDRITHFVNELLDLSAISKGRMTLNFDKVDIATLLEEVIEQLKPTAETQGLTLDYCHKKTGIPEDFSGANKPEKGTYIIHADPLRLYQIFSNLIYNGIKYTETGGVFVSVDNVQSDNQKYVEIKVHDTGIGIEPKNFPALFDQFQSVNHKINKHVESTGLGLPIALELITRHNGTISVSSTYRKGSTFTVLLPIDAEKNTLN